MATTTIQQLHGKYYKQATQNRLYYGSTASTGIALLVPNTSGNHPTLWNPAGSGRNASLVRLELSYRAGNNAPGAIEWALTPNAGSAIGTAAPIVTFTSVAPVGTLGGAVDNVCRWAPAVNTFTAAPVFTRATGLSLFTGVAATAVAPFKLVSEYNGDLVLAPGTALSLCFQTTSTTATFQVGLVWEEVTI